MAKTEGIFRLTMVRGKGLSWLISILILCCAALAVSAGSNSNKPQVALGQGTLKGKIISSASNKTVFSFTGIPYAKPPLGELRFKAPEPAGAWSGVLDATKNRSRCAQLRFPDLHYVGTEDCLFTNVYTTKLPVPGEAAPLAPVIVLIHGGLFLHSSGDPDIYGPQNVLDGEPGELVLVTFNYRLGAIGFLSTEDTECPGNFGLKDQALALRWIKENVAQFGGDPDQVTLMGDNAGGVSAHMHMLSPLSKGLFRGAISQSGTALTHWALNRDPLARTHRLAELLECGDNSTSSNVIVECLRNVGVEKIIKKSQVVLPWRTDWMVTFGVVVEDFLEDAQKPFLPGHPRDLMQSGNFTPVPWLVGVSSHDGLPHSLQLLLFQRVLADLNEDFENYAPYYFELEGEMQFASDAATLIKDFYLNGGSMGMGAQKQMANMHTDYYYFTSMVKSAALHVMGEAPPVFVYHFSYQSRNIRVAIGVPQGDDTQYVYPREDGRYPPEPDTQEMKVAQRLISLIKNFVKHGQPIPDGDDSYNVEWPPVDDQNLNFIDFNSEMSLNTTFYSERIAFWNDIDDLLATGHSILKDGPQDKDEL